jgi:anti-sigma factor ChrR (cupin superfamily)
LQIHDCARQFWREDFHVTVLYPHGRAERFETLQVQINRPVSDDAAKLARREATLARALLEQTLLPDHMPGLDQAPQLRLLVDVLLALGELDAAAFDQVLALLDQLTGR